MPNLTFYGGRKQARKNFFLSLSKLECGAQEIHFHFDIFMNKHAKKTQIHFNSDVFAALAVVDAKAPLVP